VRLFAPPLRGSNPFSLLNEQQPTYPDRLQKVLIQNLFVKRLLKRLQQQRVEEKVGHPLQFFSVCPCIVDLDLVF
jgi:hypothetical protein